MRACQQSTQQRRQSKREWSVDYTAVMERGAKWHLCSEMDGSYLVPAKHDTQGQDRDSEPAMPRCQQTATRGKQGKVIQIEPAQPNLLLLGILTGYQKVTGLIDPPGERHGVKLCCIFGCAILNGGLAGLLRRGATQCAFGSALAVKGNSTTSRINPN